MMFPPFGKLVSLGPLSFRWDVHECPNCLSKVVTWQLNLTLPRRCIALVYSREI